jgi:hypothetical protein
MDTAYEGHTIEVHPAVGSGPRDLTAQVYDQDARAVGGVVPVATWAQVELLEEKYHVHSGDTRVAEPARVILDENSGTTTT